MKTILVDALNTFVIEGNGIFEEMYDLLETFENKKIILTGEGEDEYGMLGLDKMPYEVFTLKHDPEKEDPRYYELMLEHFRLSAGDVLYIEHNEDAVKSARAVGIRTFHYDQEKKDLAALKEFLIGNL